MTPKIVMAKVPKNRKCNRKEGIQSIWTQ